MTRHTRYVLLLIALLGSISLRAQITEPTPVSLPSLSIAGSRLDATVTYDPARGIYRYSYTIVAAATNQGRILGFKIDISGRTEHLPQIDPTLQNNVRRLTNQPQLQPNTTLPVGITVPDPARTHATVTATAEAKVSLWETGDSVGPGQSAGPFIIESRFPPAMRKATLRVDTSSWQTFAEQFPPGTLFQDAKTANYDLGLTTLAPWEPDETQLFSAGGQQPAEVNKFLRYAQPTDTRIKVPSGTTAYTVIIYYGSTINTATFAATLEGTAVTNLFHPAAGSAEAVTVPIGPGTTKLHLTVEGTKASGGRGTDSDTFTFLFP